MPGPTVGSYEAMAYSAGMIPGYGCGQVPGMHLVGGSKQMGMGPMSGMGGMPLAPAPITSPGQAENIARAVQLTNAYTAIGLETFMSYGLPIDQKRLGQQQPLVPF